VSEQGLPRKVDLREFVKENYQLLASMGVFGGLTALFTRIENAEYLSFVSFMMFVVLGFELWAKFPIRKEESLNLIIFEYLSYSLVLSVLGYVILYYGAYVFGALVGILIFLGGIILKSVRDFIEKHRITRKRFRVLAYVGLGLLAFVIGMLLAVLVAYFA
jgi:hypothetical protein